MKNFLKKFLLFCALGLLLTGSARAATFSLSPDSGDIIRGCNTSISIKMDTQGAVSNGAQIYLDHSALGGGSISLSGSLFGSYGHPTPPSGIVGLFGYGGMLIGSDLTFGTIVVNANQLGAFNLTVRYGTETYASKIAEFPGSTDILTGVSSGVYTVINGYCETASPYLVNFDPVPDKPNHPVGQNITFDIRDDGSGVNLDSLVVELRQNNNLVPFNLTVTSAAPEDRLVNVLIDPVNDLIPELRVDVLILVHDKAGNVLSRVYSFNDLTCAQLGCTATGVIPQCQDGIDNDSDGYVDYPTDAGCESANDNNEFLTSDCGEPIIIMTTTTPQCSDGTDNDEDGLVDYPADGGCHSASDNNEFLSGEQIACPVLPETVLISQCSDGIDNDGDGLIDMADGGCENPDDNNEYFFGEIVCPICEEVVTEETPEATGYLNLSQVRFYLANRTVQTQASRLGAVSSLAGYSFTVGLDTSATTDRIFSVELVLADKTYPMYYDSRLKMYLADVQGLTRQEVLQGYIAVEHGEYVKDTIPFSLAVVGPGLVEGKSDGESRGLSGAKVILEQLSAGGKYVIIKETYTNSQGQYSFVVPNGSYRLSVEAEGYRVLRTAGFTVDNNIVNRSLSMIKEVDLLAPEVSVQEKIVYVKDVAAEGVGRVLESTSDPKVEKTAEKTVAPIAAASAIAATAPALSLLNLLSYLRFLFLQPVFLFGRKKRRKWGVVYNSLSKMPVDLATVRLIDNATGKVVQSRVTDAEGRYVFFVNPGLYRLEVTKKGFIFPTKILQGFKEDTTFLDIYHGEAVHVDDKYVALALNIPLDPLGVKEKTPRRIIWEGRLRALQSFIASLSIIVGILAVIISPTWWTVALLVAQVLLYFLFKRLSKAKKPKSWGFVFDKNSKKPVGQVITRLFSRQFNKLVATEITDPNGRYSFLVGPNDYYITFEKTGYEKEVSRDIKVKEKNDIIKMDVALRKFGDPGNSWFHRSEAPSAGVSSAPRSPESASPPPTDNSAKID